MLPLQEDDDIEHYLTTFERIAQACRWPTEDWVLHLVPLLTGKARAAYVAMDLDDTLVYTRVKETILVKFEINAETYRRRFRAKALQQGETPKELQARLKDLYDKWITLRHRTKEKIGEMIVLEQFLAVINPEIRTWICEHNPTSSRQAAELAETFIAARRSTYQLGHSQGGIYSATGKSGRGFGSGQLYSNTKGYSSQTPQSKSYPKSYQQSESPHKEKPVIICHGCGQAGHKKVECALQRVSNARLCYVPRPSQILGEAGQNIDTVVPVKIGGKQFMALVDTGSSQTLVREECVRDLHMSRQGKLRVRCVHGDEREYATVDLKMEVEGQPYLLTVGIVDKAPYAVILGRDVPVLVDLLQRQTGEADVRVVTRAKAKQVEERKQTLNLLPFAKEPKDKRSRREKRKEKVRGTVIVEQLPEPDKNDLYDIPHNMSDLQKQDVTLEGLFQKAGNSHSRNRLQDKERFVVKDNRLYRQTDSGDQLVVPLSIRAKVLHLGHSIPWSGHLGQQKTLARISSRFYWPRLYMDVIDYCKSCPECQLTAPVKKGDRAPLVSLPIIDVPFTRIAMDIVGPLERSRSGNRYILVVCDYATRYPEAFPLKKIKTRQIVNVLGQLFSRVGIPTEILTDQGTNFTSRQIKEVYALLGIRAIKTTPYHPQTDGMVERFNQTLKAMLRKFVSETGSDWDQWLPYLLFAYREVPQASTGYSPFELLYGRQVRGPLDILKEAWEGDKPREQVNVVSYVLRMREKMDSMAELVHITMAKSQQQQKSWYDQSSRQRTLNPGQKVLLLLPTSDSGLLAKWQGPYEILRKVGPVNYELYLPDRRKKNQVFHINLLKPWQDRSGPLSDQLFARKIDEEEESNEQYFPTVMSSPIFPELSHLTSEQQENLQLRVPEGLFSDRPGRTGVMQHDIRLLSPGPVRQTCCRVPARLIPELKNEVKVMLEMGVIEPSRSEWCSPVVLVPKKDGTLRFCVDFSKLNAVSAFDPYPMPRVDELIERLGKAKYLSTLDLCKGYWQIPLTNTSKELTAFRVPSGLYQFTVMPFGLHGAAATFQRTMDCVLRGTEDFAAAYIDDVVVYSSTWEDHMEHLSDVFSRIHGAGLVVNATKCYLAKPEVSYLGYVLGGWVIKPQMDKVEAVRSCPPPTTKKRVRSFLGLVGWYRRFISNFSTRAAVLTDLTQKGSPQKVVWSPECETAFQNLKDCLCQGPVLQSPNFDISFTVQTDASGVGLGAVLLQGDSENRRPVQYISRKLFPREVRYSTVEKEALAIKWALDTLKYYLIGKDFTLETDHRALQWLHRMKDSNARITRWFLSLQPFKFQVKYRAGAQNVVADFLSRHYDE